MATGLDEKDLHANAERCRALAEEHRKLAGLARWDFVQRMHLGLAASYESMAEQLDRLREDWLFVSAVGDRAHYRR